MFVYFYILYFSLTRHQRRVSLAAKNLLSIFSSKIYLSFAHWQTDGRSDYDNNLKIIKSLIRNVVSWMRLYATKSRKRMNKTNVYIDCLPIVVLHSTNSIFKSIFSSTTDWDRSECKHKHFGGPTNSVAFEQFYLRWN